MNYNLEVLNDKEFEQLSKDLLEGILKLPLQNFKSGKDGGIDLRHSSVNQNDIIIQAKAYTKSTFSQLKATLQEELKKMIKLSPQPRRYILTTTCPLSPQQADEVVSLMKPYILNVQDVFGRDRVESLLSNQHNIEKKYFKLWLTSTNILENILHNGQRSQSDFYKDKVLKKASLYVPTKNLDEASAKLNDNKYLIISGEPGVGKTTLAYILICDMLGKGFELINIDDRIGDAQNLLSNDPEVKQVFFYDDFLGANINEILNPRNTESKIVSFIEQIESSKNKFLILTSRTTILNQAKDRYEQFNRLNFEKRSKYELKLTEYSLLQKAKIVYNHLYYNNISEDFRDAFFEGKKYLKIIKHPNYFPRLIEFITTQHNYDRTYFKSVDSFIFNNLNNPSEIWKAAFEHQLQDEEKFLLLTVFSFAKHRVRHKELEVAFYRRYDFEIRENGHSKSLDSFNRALRKLLDSFLSSILTEEEENQYQFINPSIADFLLNYVIHSEEEQKRILYSIYDLRQLNGYFDVNNTNKIKLDIAFLRPYYPVFNKLIQTSKGRQHAYGVIDILDCMDRLFFNIDDDFFENVLFYLKELVKLLTSESYVAIAKLSSLLKSYSLRYPNVVIDCVKLNWQGIINLYIDNSNDSDDLANLEELHEIYQMDLEELLKDSDITQNVEKKLYELFSDYIRDYDVVLDENQVLDNYHSVDKDYAKSYINRKYLDSYSDFFNDCGLRDYYDYFRHDPLIDTQQILDNVLERFEYHEEEYRVESYEEIDSDNEQDDLSKIEDLFTR